ncbi:MAG: glycosyltransferase [Dethiosulfatibacter sp.]|nr:glycosyltransferase [Dethiosulfatibacter sp.]
MKISVITVSYNSEKTIRDTLKSVYTQSHDSIEHIIIDGNSIDKTTTILKEYESKFENTNIVYKWISEKDNGIYDAINKGIKMATGEVVGILNSDDYYTDSSVLADISETFVNKECECLYANLKYIDPTTEKVTRDWKSKPFRNGLFEKSWTPAHPTFYCKKSVYDKYGLYRTDFKIAADVELMYRFLEKNNILSHYLDRYIVTMRQGGVSSSGLKSTIIITKEMIRAFKDNGNHLNIVKYLFYKGLKLKEFIIDNN